jgi:hypothetical protein
VVSGTTRLFLNQNRYRSVGRTFDVPDALTADFTSRSASDEARIKKNDRGTWL